jgi:DNA-binding protein H-NS
MPGLNAINPAAAGKPDGGRRHQKRKRSDGVNESGLAPVKSNWQGKKNTARTAARYKDPQSEKTWSGRGRPPAWLVGDREQYAL